MEAIVSINLFKDLLPKYLHEQARRNNRSYFEEARNYILSNPDLAVPGYRIPTQGMNSTLALTIVDVIESTIGDTIVLPAEITTLLVLTLILTKCMLQDIIMLILMAQWKK